MYWMMNSCLSHISASRQNKFPCIKLICSYSCNNKLIYNNNNNNNNNMHFRCPCSHNQFTHRANHHI
ncbi:hypothetical protein GIB67_037588 [Kingdonia uniflora]|uniref:Uncharacterized protein n=1 Tax=Kingdonia uniflora TaxID=39325 RepID=A0A7J7LSB4_9MAGN|nr:hypothetical protein GIB67_037588 [Kingdonia uniflora]